MSFLDTIKSWFGRAPMETPEILALSPPAPQTGLDLGANGAALALIDFTAVLAAAGVEADVRERVSKAKSLLRSMPEGTPSAAKLQIVEAAFQAFEIPTQKIIQGASAEVEALRRYIQSGEEEKSLRIAEGERRIAELEAEILGVRGAMDLAVSAQDRRSKLTTEEIATVQPIVQFFVREAIAAVVLPREPPSSPPLLLDDADEVPLLDPQVLPPPALPRIAAAPRRS